MFVLQFKDEAHRCSGRRVYLRGLVKGNSGRAEIYESDETSGFKVLIADSGALSVLFSSVPPLMGGEYQIYYPINVVGLCDYTGGNVSLSEISWLEIDGGRWRVAWGDMSHSIGDAAWLRASAGDADIECGKKGVLYGWMEIAPDAVGRLRLDVERGSIDVILPDPGLYKMVRRRFPAGKAFPKFEGLAYCFGVAGITDGNYYLRDVDYIWMHAGGVWQGASVL